MGLRRPMARQGARRPASRGGGAGYPDGFVLASQLPRAASCREGAERAAHAPPSRDRRRDCAARLSRRRTPEFLRAPFGGTSVARRHPGDCSTEDSAMALSGARLGKHPIHPMLVVIPLGLWVTALVFDIVHAF